MNYQFKAGDLAIIVGANSLTQNIGKQCQLREFVQSGDCYVAPNGVVYRHDDVPCWTLVGDDLVAVIEDEVVQIGFGIHEPRHLMPLGGDFDPSELKTKAAEA
ncbi:hypothetical protein [Pseudomonas sp. W5-01]|uniref:hypothetical protein n=1 Tax=Pseudomonas sp. W5-01 TaxID=3097454 RepID=UPI00397B49D8